METELERLVVRLVGDGSEYQRMINQAATSTTAAAAKVQQAASKIEGFQNSLKGFAGQALSLLGVFGLTSSLRGAFDQFSQLERGQIRLRAAVESSGQAVGPTIERYTAMADAISGTTLATKGQILQMFTQVETMGMHGEQAERVVRNSLALAGADTENAQSMIRVAMGIERGNYQLARRALGLQGVRDETELMNLVNARMASGMRQAEAVANTTSGQLTRLGRALKSVGTDVGGMVAEVLTPFVKILKQAVDWFKSLDPPIRKIIALVTGLTLAFIALGPWWGQIKAFVGTIKALVVSLASYLFVMARVAATTVIWAAWKLVMIGVNATLFIFKTVLAIATGVLSLHKIIVVATTVATSLWAGALILVKGAVLLLTGALVVLKAILAPAFLIAAAVTASILLPVITSLAGAVVGVWTAGVSLISILREIPTTSGPIASVGAMFSEWYGILKDVVVLAQTDFPKAWQLLKAGFALAISQIKDLWPPLWNFIKEGFIVVANAVSEIFLLQWSKTQARMRNSALPSFLQDSEESMQAMERGIDRSISNRLHLTGIQLNHLVSQFSTTESQATQDARAEVTRLRGEVASALSQTPTNGPRNEMAGAVKEAQKFDAVLRGSAEAAARIGAYLEANAVQRTPRAGVPPAALAFAPANAAVGAVGGGIAGGVGGGVFGAANATVIATLLGQIARNTGVTAARPEINVEPLGLEEEQVP